MKIVYSECAIVTIGTLRELHMCRVVICGPYGSTIYLRISSVMARLKKKLLKTKCVF